MKGRGPSAVPPVLPSRHTSEKIQHILEDTEVLALQSTPDKIGNTAHRISITRAHADNNIANEETLCPRFTGWIRS